MVVRKKMVVVGMMVVVTSFRQVMMVMMKNCEDEEEAAVQEAMDEVEAEAGHDAAASKVQAMARGRKPPRSSVSKTPEQASAAGGASPCSVRA